MKELEDTVRELRDTIRTLRPAPKEQATPPPTSAPGRPTKPTEDVPKGNGIVLRSPDGNNTLRIRGYLQSDSRASLRGPSTDNFLMRRIRPVFEGTVYKYWDFKLMPDFAAGSALVQDAYVNFRYWPEAQLLAGKYKEPVSLERLQSARDLTFAERSLANNLQPNRDVGVQLHGDLLQGRLSYVLGAFDGVNDGGSTDVDTGSDKDFAGRVFAEPFKRQKGSPLQGLGLGIAGSIGGEDDTLGGLAMKTTGRSTIFKYSAGVTGGGTRARLSPQFFYYHGPLGLMGEWVNSSQEVQKGAVHGTLNNSGYFTQASYVITGEKASYTGVVPRDNFDPRNGKWGAFEIAGRYSRLNLDRDAFRLGFADPALSASGADEWTFGLNWYFNPLVKLQLNYVHTDFDHALKFGAATLSAEDLFLSRFQVAF